MNSIIKELTEPFLFTAGFQACDFLEGVNKIGSCYRLSPKFGEGFYWVYGYKNQFAISILDAVLNDDYIIEFQQPEFIEINYFDTVSGEELSPYKQLNANCIRGHVSDNKLFRARYHKNIPIHNIELILMPEFYNDYLKTKYAGEFSDPQAAFRSIDGVTDFPELVILLRQIQAFRGDGKAAELYYESKVNEAIALIIERTKSKKSPKSNRSYTSQDLNNLDSVKSYISDHFAFDIRTEHLADIAYMSQTKLRMAFKDVYGHTITDYIKNRRIAAAESLLIRTEFPIKQIAQAVGYHQSGRFSKIFQQSTGLLPEEYRKIHN